MDDPVIFARKLRREQTPAERRFWGLIHPWRVNGWHFRRQSPLGPYFADFICKRAKLVIEIDGDSHYADGAPSCDAVRTAFFETRGYRILRFTNLDVLRNPDGVFSVVTSALGEPKTPPANLPLEGGGADRTC